MSTPKPLSRPKFTPVPPDLDIRALVNTTPNFQWTHREDARHHAAPCHTLSQTIRAFTVDQGLPIVVDNWHLRNDWNAALLSCEWLEKKYGDDSSNYLLI
jgi:hypothetical protein